MPYINIANQPSIFSTKPKPIFMRIKYFVLLLSLLPMVGWGQSKSATNVFTVQQCIDYALENATGVKNALLDEQSANARVRETIGIGLPQVQGSVSVQHSPTLQRFYGTL